MTTELSNGLTVLLVDDDELSQELLGAAISAAGYNLEVVDNGQDAWEIIQQGKARIVISDWEMPKMSGLDLCRNIRKLGLPEYLYFILVTGRTSKEDMLRGMGAGADDFLTKPVNASELQARLRVGERVIGLESRDVVIYALAKLAESRDPETGAHIDRIQTYSKMLAVCLAENMQLPESLAPTFVRDVEITSPLHDIGKIGIPDSILLKRGHYNDDEFSIMKQHTVVGGRILQAAIARHPHASYLQTARDIALFHHERFDGTGYPAALSGPAIPISARIVALADVYDALTSRRLYKDALTHMVARNIIIESSGTHFDPDVVSAFLSCEEAFSTCRNEFEEKVRAQKAEESHQGSDRGLDGDINCLVESGASLTTWINDIMHEEHLGKPHELTKHVSDETQALLKEIVEKLLRVTGVSEQFRGTLDQYSAQLQDAQVQSQVQFLVDHMVQQVNSMTDSTRELQQRFEEAFSRAEQLQVLLEQTRWEAMTDPLTGLHNRKSLDFKTEEMLESFCSTGLVFSALMLDIDHFKNINDRYGHGVGDAALRKVARSIGQQLKGADFAARYGGEEFAVLLPDTSLEKAVIVAEHIRATVEDLHLLFAKTGEPLPTITVSVGATVVRQGDTPEMVFDRADGAMYLAKHSGRNNVKASA